MIAIFGFSRRYPICWLLLTFNYIKSKWNEGQLHCINFPFLFISTREREQCCWIGNEIIVDLGASVDAEEKERRLNSISIIISISNYWMKNSHSITYSNHICVLDFASSLLFDKYSNRVEFCRQEENVESICKAHKNFNLQKVTTVRQFEVEHIPSIDIDLARFTLLEQKKHKNFTFPMAFASHRYIFHESHWASVSSLPFFACFRSKLKSRKEKIEVELN